MAGIPIAKISAGGGVNSISHSFYGTCDTAQGTAAKIVKIADSNINAMDVTNGMMLSVKFTAANTVASPTLTIQTSGGTQLVAAKSIMRYGTTAPSTSATTSWNAGSVVNFVWDGSYWQMVGWLNNNDNTVPAVYISTAAATAAKVGSLTNASWSGLTGNRYLYATIYYDNTSQTALTLNICSQGAKAIYINGAASSTSNYTLPRGTYIVYYDGTNFYFRTDGKIPKLKTSGSIGISTTNITPVTKKTVVTGGSTTAVPNITKKTVVTGATFNTVVTGGTTTSITPISGVGTLPALTVTNQTVVTGTSVASEVLSFTTTTNGSASGWSAGSLPTKGTAVNAYTSLTTGASGSATTGDSVTVGTAINAYTSLTTGDSVTAGTVVAAVTGLTEA